MKSYVPVEDRPNKECASWIEAHKFMCFVPATAWGSFTQEQICTKCTARNKGHTIKAVAPPIAAIEIPVEATEPPAVVEATYTVEGREKNSCLECGNPIRRLTTTFKERGNICCACWEKKENTRKRQLGYKWRLSAPTHRNDTAWKETRHRRIAS